MFESLVAPCPVIDGCVTLSGARTCRGDVAGRARSSVGESLEAVEDEVEGEPEIVVGGGVGTVELNVFGAFILIGVALVVIVCARWRNDIGSPAEDATPALATK